MSYSPPHELPSEFQPVCDESFYFHETWKTEYSPVSSEDSNQSLSDTVPSSMSSNYESLPSAESDYGSPITGSNSNLGTQVDAFRWQNRHPEMWDRLDVSMFIQHTTEYQRLYDLRSEAFSDVDGPMMCKMQMEQFQEREPSYGAELCMAFTQHLYNQSQSPYQAFQPQLPIPSYDAADRMTSIEKYIHNHNISFDKDDTFPSLPPFESLISKPKVEPKVEPADNYSDPPPSPTSSEASSTASNPPRGRRGRSKGKLWEFVLNLLLDNDTNPSIIKWEDRSNGVFRIVRSDQVARLWGERKSNPSMTYEKMSRAMRYYYKKNILERIDGRRLVYKFGLSSKGWQQK